MTYAFSEIAGLHIFEWKLENRAALERLHKYRAKLGECSNNAG